MKTFKTIETTTIVNEFMETITTTKTRLHKIRTWDELTTEEKEEKIKEQQENIYMLYQEDLYNDFLADLDYLKYQFKNIDFETIYIDSNSQGWWIDSIKKFVYYNEGIDIYGEHIEISDIDFHIRKLIEDFDIEIFDYYIDSDKLEKIKNTRKYKKWIENIRKEINDWKDLANQYCNDIASKEYYAPYNLNDEEDREWLDMYFENEEFETIEEEE